MSGKLGFGLMRLPRKALGIDIDQVSEMVDLFLSSGFTYFDTAFVYPGSEVAIRKALIERHPRASFTLATKLFAPMVPTEKMARQEFETSLKRTGAGYFDYYLLHSLMENNYQKYGKFHLWDFVKEKKEAGEIRHYGFSFHGGPSLLDQLLTEHPDVDFVQLQINYADWDSENVQSRKNYEVARSHGKQIVVMEPVKGGKLANPPKEVQEIFREVNPDASFASWAIRFVASLDGILAVLSGMSSLDQMRDNTGFMKDFQRLTEREMEAVLKARKVFNASSEIPCTACRYCMEGCPKKIPIPEIFRLMNLRSSMGQIGNTIAEYQELTRSGNGAADCIHCKKCESVCPQHIKVSEELEKCAKAFS